jgi:hypothetical protein
MTKTLHKAFASMLFAARTVAKMIGKDCLRLNPDAVCWVTRLLDAFAGLPA